MSTYYVLSMYRLIQASHQLHYTEESEEATEKFGDLPQITQLRKWGSQS